MASKVRWGVAIPQVFLDEPTDMALVSSWAKKAEDLGYDSLWVQEGIVGSVPILEPVTLLSYVAAITDRVRLGTSVMVAPLRNPVQLAKSLSSLDHISRGRLTVGLGLGGNRDDVVPFGISPEQRVRRFVEIVDVMKALWTESEVQFPGEFWQLVGTHMEPKPVQKPHPPIWFGARQPQALRRAVRHADGWMGAGSSSTEQFVSSFGQVEMYLEESGRDPSTFAVSKRVYVALDNNEERAETRLREWFGRRYGNAEMASEVSVWGSADRCIEELAKVTSAGAEMVLLNTAFDDIEQLEALAQDVIPHL